MLQATLTSYLTWIMTFTDLTSVGIPCESIATFFVHLTGKYRTFNWAKYKHTVHILSIKQLQHFIN